MKILIISRTAWNINNSFGNTFSNIFKGIDCEIANIYCKPGLPNNELNNIKYYQITEKDLMLNIKNKKHKTGKIVYNKDNVSVESLENNFTKTHRWYFLILMREFIWKIGNWKSKELIKFIEDFQPNLIYAPIYNAWYLNDILLYFYSKLNIPMIGHISDELYKYDFSIKDPFYYWFKYFERIKVKKVIQNCKFVDCFSSIQKEEYEKIFNVPFKIRYKSANIENVEIKKEYNNPLIFLYTGNLGNQRWKNLVEIGKVLDTINKDNKKAILNIYSGTVLSKEMKEAFNNCNSLNFMGSVSGEEVQKIQAQADILIHTESFVKKEIQTVRMSLSTKIIDYLSKGKCILALGPKEVTSIDYFIQNNCGIVITNKFEINKIIGKIISNKDMLFVYAEKAFSVAIKNHSPNKLSKLFYKDLINIFKG